MKTIEQLIEEMASNNEFKTILYHRFYEDGINAVLNNKDLMELWAEENGYVKKEEVDKYAFDVYYRISKLMKVPEHLISENMDNIYHSVDTTEMVSIPEVSKEEPSNTDVLDELEKFIKSNNEYLGLIQDKEILTKIQSLKNK